jgi:hypothetical protein
VLADRSVDAERFWFPSVADAPWSRRPTRLPGEVHFGWVLGGRAVQDTRIDAPSRRVRRFIGRPVDDQIVLLSDAASPNRTLSGPTR